MVPTVRSLRNPASVANRFRPIQSLWMRLARQLERRLERLVDGLSGAIFRGRLHPVDVANRLLREADLAEREGALGTEIPNAWEVHVSSRDLEHTTSTDLARELTHVLVTTAAEQGWRTGGRVTVEVVVDEGARVGALRCTGSSVATEGDTWGELLDVRGGRALDVSDNRVLIGRGETADIRIDDPEVSRQHALMFREAGRTWICDLGSVNGTTVNGAALSGTPLSLSPGDEVTFGPATFSFRLR